VEDVVVSVALVMLDVAATAEAAAAVVVAWMECSAPLVANYVSFGMQVVAAAVVLWMTNPS
jgi:hypothetical protein